MKTILTPEQNQRLIELGVPESISTVFYCKTAGKPKEEYPTVFAFTDLLSILPKKITDRKYIYTLSIQAWDGEKDGWSMKYEKTSNYGSLEDSYQEAEELIDAIYEMIIWLKQNKDLVWL